MKVPEVEFRLLSESDAIEEINSLLRSAYSALADAGMKYAASYEDVEATRRRIAEGECHLGLSGGRIVVCAILRGPVAPLPGQWSSRKPSWYERPEVASFGRFAVLPEWQGQGVGARMMDRLEERARELGFSELALDTSENAHHLIRMYEGRGYRQVGTHQWAVTNYLSVILSKALLEPTSKGPIREKDH